MATHHDLSNETDSRPFATIVEERSSSVQDLRRLDHETRPQPLSQAAQRQEDTSVVVAPSGFSPYIPPYSNRRSDEIEMRVFDLENQVEENRDICKTSAIDHDRQIGDLQAFASSVESDIRDLQTSVSSLSSKLSTLQSLCSSTESCISTLLTSGNEACLKASVEVQAAQMDGIQASVEAGVIKKLETKVMCEGQIEVLSRRLDNVEGRLRRVETVSELKEMVDSQVL